MKKVLRLTAIDCDVKEVPHGRTLSQLYGEIGLMNLGGSGLGTGSAHSLSVTQALPQGVPSTSFSVSYKWQRRPGLLSHTPFVLTNMDLGAGDFTCMPLSEMFPICSGSAVCSCHHTAGARGAVGSTDGPVATLGYSTMTPAKGRATTSASTL